MPTKYVPIVAIANVFRMRREKKVWALVLDFEGLSRSGGCGRGTHIYLNVHLRWYSVHSLFFTLAVTLGISNSTTYRDDRPISTGTAYISSSCGSCPIIWCSRCHRNCLYVVFWIHRFCFHSTKWFLWKLSYQGSQAGSTDTTYKSVVTRQDNFFSVTRIISSFCVSCLSFLVEQFPQKLLIYCILS